MAWFTGQLLLLLIVAFLLGLLLGYLVWMYGWRKRVRETVDVETSTREVVGRDEGFAAAERREWEAALDARDATIAARDRRIAELEARIAPAAAHGGPAEGDGTAGGGPGSDETESDEPRIIVLDEPGSEPAASIRSRTGPGVAADAVGDDGAVATVTAVETVTEPDDLTRVEGIGPKMQAALYDAGVLTFEDLSTTSEHEIRAAIVAAGMRFAPSVPSWPTQARLLADGDDEALATYQQSLSADRQRPS